MLKWLLLLIVGLVIYGVIRSRAMSSARSGSTEHKSITTVRCAHCGVHLDRQEALLADSLTFCCEAHRKQWVSSH